jgi:hypothetical protein
MIFNLPRTLLLVSSAGLLSQTSVVAFVPAKQAFSHGTTLHQSSEDAAAALSKPTGTSFLPQETIERAEKGSPIEKFKMARDPMSSFVDVYEYARKIREGEMTWEEVEKADLDNVRYTT